jgi:hypothetical protein
VPKIATTKKVRKDDVFSVVATAPRAAGDLCELYALDRVLEKAFTA